MHPSTSYKLGACAATASTAAAATESTRMAACVEIFCRFDDLQQRRRGSSFFLLSTPSLPPAGTCSTPADAVWEEIVAEARSDVADEPILRGVYDTCVLLHSDILSALAALLAKKLCLRGALGEEELRELLLGALNAGGRGTLDAVAADLLAARERDPATEKLVHCFLYSKGFHAVEAYRAAHRLWRDGRRAAALMLQSRMSEAFAVDIHPAARIGCGLVIDHATGVVIGETAVVGDDVTMLHGVTLGGTGKECGSDRHPKVGNGVLLGAGAKVLGNVRIGDAAKVGAGAVVLREVPAGATAVGNPARVVDSGKKKLILN